MTILVTGAAGFIGFHVCRLLLDRGDKVLGVDNLNDYYEPSLKTARLEQLEGYRNFQFANADIADHSALEAFASGNKTKKILHLAAQAGVRYSLENPRSYAQSNLVGQVNILELARHAPDLEHLVYASSSSVYGGRTDLPFKETDRADKPVSLYAATKRCAELMGYTYAHLYGIQQTGLRFFTVYGPWGRPDMAYWSFTDKILKGEEIQVFNNGDMLRDFTYIDDIVDGIVRILDQGPKQSSEVPHQVYNIGNNKAEKLETFLSILERETGKKAVRINLPMQPGDVPATYADIEAIKADYGFEPKTGLEEGLRRFVGWFRQHHGV